MRPPLAAQSLTRLFVPPMSKLAGGAAAATVPELLAHHGFVRQAGAGVYDMLPLGLRVQQRIEAIVRKHLDATGAAEFALTSLASPRLWERSGRLGSEIAAQLMFTEERRHLLAPTAEEQVTDAVGSVSYRRLPLSLYQVTRKYRDELRPRGGLLRTREFVMKDLYTVDATPEAAAEAYAAVQSAYRGIFDELGVPYLVARAASGDMGGSHSHEFHYPAAVGDDRVLHCKTCHWAANVETFPEAAANAAPAELLADSHGRCPKCLSKDMHVVAAVEVGHTFLLGTRYSEPLGATVMGADGAERPLEMGSYGIGVSRLVAAVAEAARDVHGLVWPAAVAPASAAVVSSDSELAAALAAELAAAGHAAVWDDRTPQLGHAMRAAREAGWPVLVIAGKRYAQTGELEVELRRTGEKRAATRADLPGVVAALLGPPGTR